MARLIPLIPGSKVYAGANLPFYVSQRMVTDYLTGKGFRNVVWHDRDQALPMGIEPAKDPQYDDDWDVWASADYLGQAGQLNPPADPSWLRVELPPAPAPASPPFAAAAPAGGAQGPLPALTSGVSSAPLLRPIVTDPAIVRRYRLGVAAAVFGAALALGAAAWDIFRSPPEPMKPSGEV